jgi:hypothetical protein
MSWRMNYSASQKEPFADLERDKNLLTKLGTPDSVYHLLRYRNHFELNNVKGDVTAILEEILRTRGESGSTEVAKAALQRGERARDAHLRQIPTG